MAVSEDKIKEYLRMSHTIILATTDLEGLPDIRTIGGFGVTGYEIYFSTSNKSNKVIQIEKNNEVAVFFQHENQFISKYFNVTVYGHAELLTHKADINNAKEIILTRNGGLKIAKDTHNIYKVLPKRIKILDFAEKNANERTHVIQF
ncbi:MAG: pyridoxamine 5-phosphate oxidase-related FMN-binding [Anaerocolumna sp.]|jgi:general stress protein 26|nr:pyridoxamine 5-phosphate oxidase-related FMN-binding [Anaerocolumna sp.]